jgi:steroid delta-isomerase-like uncharacterized protein
VAAEYIPREVRAKRRTMAPALAAVTAAVATGSALAALERRRRGRRAGTAGGDGRLIVRWVLEEPWKGHWDVVERHVAATFVGQDLGESRSFVGPDGLRTRLERYVAAFPDGRVVVDEQTAAGTGVTSRWTLTGTQVGELDGLPPSGRQVTVSGITISRVDGDRVVEEWTSWDRLGMLVQIGAISEPAHA